MATTATSNIEIVKTAFERFFEGDIPGFLNLLSPQVEWDHRGPEIIPHSRMYQGREEVAEFFRTLGANQENLQFDLHEHLAAGARVVTLGRFAWRVLSTGKEWAADFAMAFTLEGGLVTHWKPLFDMSPAAAAHE